MRRTLSALGLALLAACAPVAEVPDRRAPANLVLPPMKTFGAVSAPRAARPNTQIAADILDLAFRLESGRVLPMLTRFEGPVRVVLTGTVPPTAAGELDRLIARLRAEAGIDIARAPAGTQGNLTVEFIPRSTLQRAVPQAACFVVPRVRSFAEFRQARNAAASDWTTLTVREAAAVFIPSDVAPQEVRDCLHEEVAQALGPLNDLYRLPDSVFNDDNFHTVLTGFDMLVLRALYAPDLASGMTEAQVAARLPAILARLNPRGGRADGPLPRQPENRAWIAAIETALSGRTPPAQRRAAAGRAVAIAQAAGWSDGRLAFSWFTLGRSALAREIDTALTAYVRAGEIYGASPLTAIHKAHVSMQMAAFALSGGRPDTAVDIVNAEIPVALEAQNAALLSTLLLLKSEALEALGRRSEAATVRLDSLGWARYGFGGTEAVRAQVDGIAALRPAAQQPATRRSGP